MESQSGIMKTNDLISRDDYAALGLALGDESIVGHPQERFNRVMGRFCRPATISGRKSSKPVSVPAAAPIRGIREYLAPDIGSGYWDIYSIGEGFSISVTDAVYRHDQWIDVEGANQFKIRLLLSGRLLGADAQPLIQGPHGHLSVTTERSNCGYMIAHGERTQMVVIHCFVGRDVLEQRLFLTRDTTPPPFRQLFDADGAETSQSFNLSQGLASAARQFVEARQWLPSHLQMTYIEAVCLQILSLVIAHETRNHASDNSILELRPCEVQRVDAARDYLMAHFVTPPRISELARQVGLNQTRLKACFKARVGMTIYDFILQRRMDHARELLEDGSYSISEVAYRVGYSYPASFTAAFRRRCGIRPNRRKPA